MDEQLFRAAALGTDGDVPAPRPHLEAPRGRPALFAEMKLVD
jgi:hypothetical protein